MQVSFVVFSVYYTAKKKTVNMNVRLEDNANLLFHVPHTHFRFKILIKAAVFTSTTFQY